MTRLSLLLSSDVDFPSLYVMQFFNEFTFVQNRFIQLLKTICSSRAFLQCLSVSKKVLERSGKVIHFCFNSSFFRSLWKASKRTHGMSCQRLTLTPPTLCRSAVPMMSWQNITLGIPLEPGPSQLKWSPWPKV